MLITLQNKKAELEGEIEYYKDEIKKAAEKIAFIDELIEEYNDSKDTEERTLEVAHTAE